MGQYAWAERRAAPMLIKLGPLLGWAIALGLCAIVFYFLKAFFHFATTVIGDTVGLIPGLGGWVKSKIEKAEQKATNQLGDVVHSLEQRVADAFHATADQVLSLGHEIFGLSLALWQLTSWLVHGLGVAALGPRMSELTRQAAIARAQADNIGRRENYDRTAIRHADTGPIAAALKPTLHAIEVGAELGARLGNPALRARQRELEHTIPNSLEALRSHVAGVERGLEALWARVRHLDKVTTGVLASALVASALARLGLGWIRCSNWRKIGRAGCRLPAGLLEDLLALAVDALTVVELCRVAQAAQAIARRTVPLLEPLLLVADAVCLGGGASYPSAYVQPPTSDRVVHLTVV